MTTIAQRRQAEEIILFEAAEDALNIRREENAIIAAAMTVAEAHGWSVRQRANLYKRLEEQVREVKAEETQRLIEICHPDHPSDIVGRWDD